MENTYKLMIRQLDSILDNESNIIGNLANASALLFQTLPDLNWAGFYLYDKTSDALVLGPFQGKVACMRIPINVGVCGKAAYQQESIVVDDVHAFEGHIACDSASNSEIVIPIIINDTIFGVLDIDAPITNRFNDKDLYYLEDFVAVLKKYILI
jgi:GAF domain-containing protein